MNKTSPLPTDESRGFESLYLEKYSEDLKLLAVVEYTRNLVFQRIFVYFIIVLKKKTNNILFGMNIFYILIPVLQLSN